MSALNITDLNNAQLDVNTIASVATSTAATVTDRLGNTKSTLLGAVNSLKAFNVRGVWATATAYALKDVYTYSGYAYLVIAAHTSTTVAADLTSGYVTLHQGATREDLAAPGGSETIGHIGAGGASIKTTVKAKLQERITILDDMNIFERNDVLAGTYLIDVSAAIQSVLDRGGDIYLLNTKCRIDRPLTIRGKTSLLGAGRGVSIIKWYGITTGDIIRDSSRVTPTDVNKDIKLWDFEVDGNSYALGDTCGIHFYRTGRLSVNNIYVHDTGSSLFNFGTSRTDTKNIDIYGSTFERARTGDGLQGAGRNVTVTNCNASDCGDTCFATLLDFNPITNGGGDYPQNITFTNCGAMGNYVNGVFTGAGNRSQIGFAFGPYGIGQNINIKMSGCTCEGLYSNVWAVVFDKLKLIGNTFKPAAVLDTGGVRLDGIGTAVIEGNTFEASFVGIGSEYQSLLIKAGRFVYGASTFDASSLHTVISGNIFQNNANEALQVSVDPTYATVKNMSITGNVFTDTTAPIAFSPLTGDGANVFIEITVSGNTVDRFATVMVNAAGGAAQYKDCQLLNNNLGAVPEISGTAAVGFYVIGTRKYAVAAVPDAVPTTVYTLSSDYSTIEITAYVYAGSQAFVAVAVIVNNGGSARIVWQSNGANFTLTLAGLAVQVTQSGIGTQVANVVARRLS